MKNIIVGGIGGFLIACTLRSFNIKEGWAYWLLFIALVFAWTFFITWIEDEKSN